PQPQHVTPKAAANAKAIATKHPKTSRGRRRGRSPQWEGKKAIESHRANPHHEALRCHDARLGGCPPMNSGTRSRPPEPYTKEFLDTMRLTALTAEELPAILYAGGFAAELALENPNLPLSALQNTKAITEPDLEVVGGLVEIARSPFAPEWLLELALQCNN